MTAAVPALLLSLLAGHSLAHPKREVVRIEREKVLVEVSYELAPGDDAGSIRRLFDKNRDGILEPSEVKGATEFLARVATLFLELSIDGVPAKPVREEVRSHGLQGRTDDTSAAAILVRLSLPWPTLTAAPRVLRLADRDRDVSVHVPVHLEPGEGVLVVGAAGGVPGEAPALAEGAAIEVAVVLAPPAAP